MFRFNARNMTDMFVFLIDMSVFLMSLNIFMFTIVPYLLLKVGGENDLVLAHLNPHAAANTCILIPPRLTACIPDTLYYLSLTRFTDIDHRSSCSLFHCFTHASFLLLS